MRLHYRQFLLLLPVLLGYYTPAFAATAHHAGHHPVRNPIKRRPPTKQLAPPQPPSRARVIHTLMAQLGKPYRWGGDSPHTGFDCSGLVYYTWHKNFNMQLPRTAKGMYAMPQAHPVSFHQLAPGDMVFFSMHGQHIDHVGVFLGKGQFIEAPHSGENVKIASLNNSNYRRHYRGARRLLTVRHGIG
ncbi:C40 family peptidase [Serratia nevei]|uniref:C40 family peptidase n=1 Tax=Serratia nevei TaxID=2703794 RepID=UPI00313D4138